MKKINLILLLLLSVSFVVFNSCDSDDDETKFDYVTFAQTEYSKGVDVGGTQSFDITVYTAANVGSDKAFTIAVDPSSDAAAGSYTLPTSVIIPSGSNEGTFTVTLSDVNLGIGINNLILNFDALGDFYDGGSTTIAYVQNCAEVTLTLDLTFWDSWPQEAFWEIQDSLGGVVASVAAGTYAGMTSATETITLCGGRDFTFILKDDFGDGGHTYSLKLDGVVKAEVTAPYSYESSISTEFDTK